MRRREGISNILLILMPSGRALYIHILTNFAKYAKQKLLKYVILVAERKSKIEYTNIMIASEATGNPTDTFIISRTP